MEYTLGCCFLLHWSQTELSPWPADLFVLRILHLVELSVGCYISWKDVNFDPRLHFLCAVEYTVGNCSEMLSAVLQAYIQTLVFACPLFVDFLLPFGLIFGWMVTEAFHRSKQWVFRFIFFVFICINRLTYSVWLWRSGTFIKLVSVLSHMIYWRSCLLLWQQELYIQHKYSFALCSYKCLPTLIKKGIVYVLLRHHLAEPIPHLIVMKLWVWSNSWWWVSW